MSEREPITAELRELLADVNWTEIESHDLDGWLDAWHAEADRRCDAIDAVHAQLERENAELRAKLDNMGESMHDDWVLLPLDADGVPIHVGDVMEWPTTHETFEVVGIGDGTLFYIEDGSEQADWTGASTKRHHHAPTVEDVLREMADRFYADEDEPRNRDAIVAEFAAKLRLAGDAE